MKTYSPRHGSNGCLAIAIGIGAIAAVAVALILAVVLNGAIPA